MPIKRLQKSDTRRGDTIIEAMFAFAVFSLVAIVTVSMMNLGIAASERSLELSTARNELNAQAEALRFIHSSYISEATLPECSAENPINCQQYQGIWEKITNNAIAHDEITIEYPLSSCQDAYNDNRLAKHNAFVINTRKLGSDTSNSYFSVLNHNNSFQPAMLNARIVYTKPAGSSDDSTTKLVTSTEYTTIAQVEGIWAFAVEGPKTNGQHVPQYYDFYIQTCWYGSNNVAPTSLDTMVRLYNPEGA